MKKGKSEMENRIEKNKTKKNLDEKNNTNRL